MLERLKVLNKKKSLKQSVLNKSNVAPTKNMSKLGMNNSSTMLTVIKAATQLRRFLKFKENNMEIESYNRLCEAYDAIMLEDPLLRTK